jgi:glycosyltransferase involved in cell wall biosynthesis
VEIVTTLGVGGAEMHLLALTKGLLARGHTPEIVYLKGAGELAADFLKSGIPVHKIPMERGSQSLAAILRLRRFLRRAKPDVVHTHLLKADAVGAIAALLAGDRRRLLSSKHNDERALLNPAVSRAHGWLSALDQRVIVLSDHVGRFVADHGRVWPGKIRRVYYGVDDAPFANAQANGFREELGLRKEDFVITCVARFAPQKAHEVLLRALSQGLLENPNLRLLLVGDDPFGGDRLRAEAVAKDLKLGDRVRFLGIRRDVPRILAASDLFAMSSLWEGLGLVFLEAMAARLPIVATRVSAIPEVVPHGTAGLLVPPNDPTAMARAFLSIAARDDRGRALGEAGRAWVRERFGVERMVDETLLVLEGVAARA